MSGKYGVRPEGQTPGVRSSDLTPHSVHVAFFLTLVTRFFARLIEPPAVTR